MKKKAILKTIIGVLITFVIIGDGTIFADQVNPYDPYGLKKQMTFVEGVESQTVYDWLAFVLVTGGLIIGRYMG